MLPVELQAYGIAYPEVIERDATGGRMKLAIAAVRDRVIVVDVRASGSVCVATATATIAGTPASLWSVYLRLRWPFGVESLTLAGRAVDDGRIVEEKLRP